VILAGACSSPSPPRETAPPKPIVLAGAETLAPMLRGEMLAFKDQYPKSARIEIRANGSAEGMEQLVNGDVAMAVLTRELTDPEVKAAVSRAGLDAYPVAFDAVAVIVNRACPVEQLSRTELADIYRGAITGWDTLGWRAGGAIVPLTVMPQYGLYEFIQQSLLGGDAYGKDVYAQKDEEDVVRTVAKIPGAVGLVSHSLVDDRVRALSLSPALGLPYTPLTRESLMLKKYPLMRCISLCTPEHADATASDFITFVSSMDGQRTAVRYGYAPATVPVQVVRTVEEE
jgi:phosphate transport system substrate-binding protein